MQKPYEIILEQLGGNKFVAMTGAGPFFRHDETGLSFRFKGCRKLNHCKITLTPADLYRVEFCKIGTARTRFAITNQAEFDGIYWNQLQTLFTDETGLDTHL